MEELFRISEISACIKHGIERRSIRLRFQRHIYDTANPPKNGTEEFDGLRGAVVARGGEAADDGAPGLDVGEVAGLEHGLDDGGGVERVAGSRSGVGKEAEGVGI